MEGLKTFLGLCITYEHFLSTDGVPQRRAAAGGSAAGEPVAGGLTAGAGAGAAGGLPSKIRQNKNISNQQQALKRRISNHEMSSINFYRYR